MTIQRDNPEGILFTGLPTGYIRIVWAFSSFSYEFILRLFFPLPLISLYLALKTKLHFFLLSFEKEVQQGVSLDLKKGLSSGAHKI